MKTALAPTPKKKRAFAAALQFYRPADFPLERLEKFLPHVSADRMACELMRAGERLNVALARTAVAFVAAECWSPFGYQRLGDFTREVLDRSGRWLRDLAVLGRGLETIPGLDRALLGRDSGAPIGRVAGTCIARVATADTVQSWLALARRSTVRELRDAVRAARQSQLATPPTNPNAPPEPATQQTQQPASPVADPNRRVAEEDEEETALCDVRILVKRPVWAAFEETLDLHRAISGYQASIASFVEALTGEAASGFAPPDVDVAPRVPQLPTNVARAIEERLAHSTRLWEALGPRPSVQDMPHLQAVPATQASESLPAASEPDRPEFLTRRIESALGQVDCLARCAGTGGAFELARQLNDLVQLENEIERSLGHLLNEMRSRGDFANLGFASVAHYAEQRLGMSRRTAERRTGILNALRHLPRTLAAYETGQLGLQTSWIVRRIVGSKPVARDLEEAWVAQGQALTVKRMEHEARAAGLRAQGLLESNDRDPRWPATDAEWHASLWRAPGMSRERVAQLGRQALEPTCDNVFLRLRLPEEIATAFLETLEGARQQLAQEAQSRSDLDENDTNIPRSLLAARDSLRRSQDVPAWVALLGILEDFVQTWDDPRNFKKHRWNHIFMRDGYRCMAPGCTSRRNLETHHLIYRSHLGNDDPSNLSILCQGHHQRGEHGQLATCKGKAPLGVTWRLGRPELATWFQNERKIDPPEETGPDRTTVWGLSGK